MEEAVLTQPAYPAARVAAVRIAAHLERHAARMPEAAKPFAAPDKAAMEAMIEAAFWASLRREEGFTPRISLAFVGPEALRFPLIFGRRLPLAAQPLTKLGPAVERPGIHLGVWRDSAGQFYVWGATRKLPPYSAVVEVVAPGLLVVKHSRDGESRKFVNIAVFEGDEIKIIDEQSASLPDCPGLLTSLFDSDTRRATSEAAGMLVRLALSMRRHGHGGSLLIVPSGTDAWRESIVHPMLYGLDPPFTGLSELMRRGVAPDADRSWLDALESAIDAIAGLTAVDGATIMTDNYEVLAFGAKITRRDGSTRVSEVLVTEPIEGSKAEILEPSQLGGTRHLSASQFARDQPDSLALVASQDGRFTAFCWSKCESMVHVHRIEVLLL
ncbi:MAG TPA: hypothetical protein VKV17_03990 [Bryobacteraceae bacterium]|nr:hypothetical protein [Bryobacteraceae bacterium]